LRRVWDQGAGLHGSPFGFDGFLWAAERCHPSTIVSDTASSSSSARPLLFILLVVLALTAYYGVRLWTASAPAPHNGDVWQERPLAETDLPPWEQPLPDGAVEPPPVQPEFDVQVELRREGLRNAIYFQIRERHGFLADGVYVHFWHQHQDPETGEWIRDSEPIEFLCRYRLEFGGSLTDNTVLTDLEASEIPDLGTSENWAAHVVAVKRVAARAFTPMDDQAASGPTDESEP